MVANTETKARNMSESANVPEVLDNLSAPTLVGMDIMSSTLRSRTLVVTLTLPEGRADGTTTHRISGRLVLPIDTAVRLLQQVDALVKKAHAQGQLAEPKA